MSVTVQGLARRIEARLEELDANLRQRSVYKLASDVMLKFGYVTDFELDSLIACRQSGRALNLYSGRKPKKSKPIKSASGVRVDLYVDQGGLCGYCGKKCRDPRLGKTVLDDDDFTIDHIQPRASGGTNAKSNLIGACHGCNRLKADLPLEVFLNAYGYTLTRKGNQINENTI